MTSKSLASTEPLKVLPPWMDEEALWGYYERLEFLNHRSARLIADHHPIALTFRRGINLLPSNARTSCPLGSPGIDVIREHTAANIVLWNCSPEAFSFWSAILRGDSQAPKNGLGRYSVDVLYPRHCRECDREATHSSDIGSPFWHRLFTLRFVAVCPRHRLPLLGGCGKCFLVDFYRGHNRMPSLRCACGATSRPVIVASARELTFLHRIAVIAEEMISREVPDVVVQHGRAVLNAELRRRSQGGIGRAAEFLSQLDEQGLLDQFEGETLGAIDERTLIAGIRGAGGPGLLERIILISELFGSLESFVDACDRYSLGRPVPRTETILAHRSRLLAILDESPELTRTDLRQFYCYLALSRWDSEWVSDRLPASRTGLKLVAGTGWQWWDQSAEAVDAAAKLVTDRAARIRQVTPPKRVTYRALALAGLGLPHVRESLSPKLESTVESVLESSKDYQRRWLRWAEAHHEAFRDEFHWKRSIHDRRERYGL